MTAVRIRIGPGGRELVFHGHEVLVVGRHADCHVRLPDDPAAAAHHLLLEVNPPHVRVRALSHRARLDVNGRPVPDSGRRQVPGYCVDLRDGDELRVGGTVLRVRVDGPDAAYDTRAAASDPRALLARVAAGAAPHRAPDVAHHELCAVLGTGGFGAVYRARHRPSGRTVALKVLLPRVAVEAGTRDRFRREVEVQARLAHPNVVPLHEHGETADGRFWFTMELCPGGSLATHVQAAGGRLELAEAAPLMLGALAGLAAAHDRGFVHRDVKPHNILLAAAPHRPGWTAKISDFGLARSFDETGVFGMTTTDGQAGSWPYMPREQLLDFRDVRPTSDVWSVAATFYEVLAGVPPRDAGPDQDPLAAVLETRPDPVRTRVPDLPPPVARVIDRALEVDVDRRYPDANALLTALRAALREAW